MSKDIAGFYFKRKMYDVSYHLTHIHFLSWSSLLPKIFSISGLLKGYATWNRVEKKMTLKNRTLWSDIIKSIWIAVWKNVNHIISSSRLPLFSLVCESCIYH
jgi:hypothetical protein